MNCLQLAGEVKDSTNYFQLLRLFFRSLISGKSDLYSKEFLPLLGGKIQTITRLSCLLH
jgi:hypothetical protein